MVSLVQMDCRLGEPGGNFDRAAAHVAEASRRGSGLVLLPELWSTAYALDRAAELASPLASTPEDGGWFGRFATLARENRVWLAGSLLWLAVAVRRLRAFQELLRHAEPASADIAALAEELATRMGVRCPPVAALPGVITPLVWCAFGKPQLVIPAALLKQLDTERWRTLLAHELAHLRRREGRWEIFFECRRPAGGAGATAAPAGRDEESITLLLGAGDAGDAAVALIVPEQGAWQVARGADDGTLQVHRRSAADRWLCRLVLPDAWLPGAGAGVPEAPLLVGTRLFDDRVVGLPVRVVNHVIELHLGERDRTCIPTVGDAAENAALLVSH